MTSSRTKGRTCRHFKALCRKNAIIWKRSFICTIFQLLLPCLLMVFLVWARSMVAIKHTNLRELGKYKHPVFPGLNYELNRKELSWQWEPDFVTQVEQEFMTYAGYAPKRPFAPAPEVEIPTAAEDINIEENYSAPYEGRTQPNNNSGNLKNVKDSQQAIDQANNDRLLKEERVSFTLPRSLDTFDYEGSEENDENKLDHYDLIQDWMGPVYWAPNQCLRETSFVSPKKASPIIAIVDSGTYGVSNELQEGIMQYYQMLVKKQKKIVSLALVPNYKIMTFASQEELYEWVTSPDYMVKRSHDGICFGFEIKQDAPNVFSANLYYNDKHRVKSHFANGIPDQLEQVWTPQRQSPNMNAFEAYQRRGYAYLHNLMANQILKQVTNDASANISMMMAPVPGSVSIEDDFTPALSVLLPLCLLLAYIPIVYNQVFLLVAEKESRSKEIMRIMGMTDLPYWLSWFVFYTIINTVVTTLCWGVLLINVITYSQPFYLWIFFWLYGEAVFGQILFLQSLFSGSKYAGIVSTVIYFTGVLVNHLVADDEVSRTAKLAASLLPQVALMQGSAVFAQYEGTGVGLDKSSVSIIYYGYSFNTGLLMLVLDFFLFTFLGLYLDKIIPSEFGQRLSPCFCCMPSFYRCCRKPRERRQVKDGADNENFEDCDDEFESRQMEPQNYEGPPTMCRRLETTGDFLRVEGLQKTFSGGFQAVRGVNVKMFDSQIFALLGHNGAGKTTVISMLTGLIEKSQGNAKAYDVDVFEEMEEVREFMGVCPQHDVLFDLLTPREHLDIFYDFKGGDPANKQEEIDRLIEDSGLHIDQNKISSTLSGGNKRKTSVCIALCGNSKLVMLDEPTAGMDLGARRNLWDMLKSYKRDRIIVLTTHYMDEADVLGDRIGIMVQGQLKCIGSPLFLKNRFGVGYRITFVKNRRKSHPGLEKYLQSYFQGVQKAGEVHEEVSFVIPKAEANNFGGFFENLDTRLDDFDVRSYGVSMSNLEDVFLKINKEYAPDLFGDLKGLDSSQNSSNVSSDDETTKAKESHLRNSGGFSVRTIAHSQDTEASPDQTKQTLLDPNAMSMQEQDQENIENLIRGSSCVRSCTASGAKRVIIYKRDWCGLLCQIVIPLVLVLFGLWMTSGPSKLMQSPPRPLSTGFYPYKQRILMNENPVNMTGDGNDVMGSELYAMLPNATDAFEVSYHDNLNYTEFYDAVFAARQDGDPFPYRYGSYQIFKANKAENLYQVVNFLNVTSQDVSGMYPQYIYNSILRVATGQPDLEFNVITTPFPIYQMFKDQESAARATDFTFMVAISMALIPCVMVQFILNEREKQLKHQQLLSGMSLTGYWMSNLIFDILMAYIPVGLIILLMFAFGKFYQGVWVLFLLFPPAVVPFTYVSSFIFSSDITAQIVTLFIHFVFGALGTAIVFTLQQIPITMVWGDALRWVFCIVPSFCVTHGILWSASGELVRNTREDSDTGGDDPIPIPRKIPEDLWAWYNLKGDAVILIGHFFIGLLLLAIIEMEVDQLFFWGPSISIRSCKSRSQRGPDLVKDDDVMAEEQRVSLQRTEWNNDEEREENFNKGLKDTEVSGEQTKDPTRLDAIRVYNFQKIYEPSFAVPITAVAQASFGLDYGECFALLGVNGAGKSTTFKSLTREIAPTTGKITVQGYDVQTEFADARKLIGYCPQYDAIFPELTVEETIKFYALVKGIRTNKIMEVVNKAIKELNLKDHRNKLAGTLSGGNKRKLSVAMAIIGNPPVILLDEPSAGMDPEARRFMWQVVEKISQRDKKSAVILTTHSMEEAEALSTKMGIMVRGGVFRCMGSTQHIKNKFGVGYEIEIKVTKASYNELTQLAQSLDLNTDLQSKVNLSEAIQKSEAHYESQIIEQIRKDGLGADLVDEAEHENEEVRLRNFVEYLNAQESGFKIIHWMSSNFKQVELLEQCGDFFKLRVPKEDKTIGWLFGKLEQVKRSLGIQEYSVSQTTLEQIFQNFAKQSISSDTAAYTFRLVSDKLILVNADRKNTEGQEELSQRGLSFAGGSLLKQSDLPLEFGEIDDQPSSLLLPKSD